MARAPRNLVDWAVVLFLAAAMTLVVLAFVARSNVQAVEWTVDDRQDLALGYMGAGLDTLEGAYWQLEKRVSVLEAEIAPRNTH